MKIELTSDFTDDITLKSLQKSRKMLKEDLRCYKRGESIGVFNLDRDKDIKYIKKHIKALDLIIRYFSVY